MAALRQHRPLTFSLILGFALAVGTVGGANAADEGPGEENDDGLEWSSKPGHIKLFSGYAPDTAATAYANIKGGAEIVLSDNWSADIVLRADGYRENRHNSGLQVRELKLDGENVLLKWTSAQSRVSAGYGIVRWGVTDEISPLDRVAALDLTRYTLNTLDERRRGVPMLRYEWFGDDITVDLVARPWFREARMPEFDSIWSPVDRQQGRIAGFPDDPRISTLVRNVDFDDPVDGSGGFAARVSGNHNGFDWGVSLQRQRKSAPYYRLESHGDDLKFVGKHPMRWVAGASLAGSIGKLTARGEAVYFSDEPVTTDPGGEYKLVSAFEAVAGIDWWPGDKDTLVVLQVATRFLNSDDKVLDQTASIALTGSVRHEWGRGDWQAETRYFVGLNHRSYYFNPHITWSRWAPHSFDLGIHLFGGDEDTVNGYYDDNDQIALEWQLKW